MGSQRVEHDWPTFTFHNKIIYHHIGVLCVGEGNGNLLQCSCLEDPKNGGAWWAAVYGVAQSRTWLKQFSSSSSSRCSIVNSVTYSIRFFTVWATREVPFYQLLKLIQELTQHIFLEHFCEPCFEVEKISWFGSFRYQQLQRLYTYQFKWPVFLLHSFLFDSNKDLNYIK